MYGSAKLNNGYYEPVTDIAYSQYEIRIGDINITEFTLNVGSQRISQMDTVYVTIQYTKN